MEAYDIRVHPCKLVRPQIHCIEGNVDKLRDVLRENVDISDFYSIGSKNRLGDRDEGSDRVRIDWEPFTLHSFAQR